jgi:hypothetical protein
MQVIVIIIRLSRRSARKNQPVRRGARQSMVITTATTTLLRIVK